MGLVLGDKGRLVSPSTPKLVVEALCQQRNWHLWDIAASVPDNLGIAVIRAPPQQKRDYSRV